MPSHILKMGLKLIKSVEVPNLINTKDFSPVNTVVQPELCS